MARPARDLGPRTTCYNRFVSWRRAGVRDQIIEALAAGHDAAATQQNEQLSPWRVEMIDYSEHDKKRDTDKRVVRRDSRIAHRGLT